MTKIRPLENFEKSAETLCFAAGEMLPRGDGVPPNSIEFTYTNGFRVETETESGTFYFSALISDLLRIVQVRPACLASQHLQKNQEASGQIIFLRLNFQKCEASGHWADGSGSRRTQEAKKIAYLALCEHLKDKNLDLQVLLLSYS